MDELLQSSPPASGDEQPVSHGGMACRHGPDRGGEDCGYAASLGQRKGVAHIPTADANAAAGSCLILKDKGRRDHTLTSAIHGPAFGVHFSRVQLRGVVTRSLEELAPLAAEVAANADLLKRFEDVAFGDDSRRTYEVAQEINAYVRTFYPSLTDHEGLKVQLVIANMIGRRKGKF